ncbi:aldehyde dehydrogenase family protein [Bacillus sp. ISL-47]|uniref:alpha-ketoglutaric semialdehyde dehydrogenase GucD n=1 Tax=Bacillus sp. ISL-47 TaxID=2819130 RepID=UPI001BECA0E2|nr:alpha-ketoglutaric semialdehyde dehydrogenase GucD [Bacillus sp. ISL-47]MBT2689843.1 aldehyde dehydrogenase family protein [Bacillus sp. ISL-47]MBT2710220.1 aldehyde dehydrogenase family protein [Pseudomonas sp. ISL-84]
MSLKTETITYYNFINGEWKSSNSNEKIESKNPADNTEIVGIVQKSTEKDLDEAVMAAKSAQKAWRNKGFIARGQYLYKIAEVLEENIEDIAITMTKEMGKTLAEAKGETMRAISVFKYYASEGMNKIGDVIPHTESDGLMYTTRVPLGVVGIITPWNFPIAIAAWKIAPAIVSGNTVVFKPAQETSITAVKLVKCIAEAGIPKGVVNLVTGTGSTIGQGIIDHADIQAISFTGSNDVGKRVAIGAASRGAKFQTEMGGKNPVIVADDADLDLAVEQTINGGLKSTGQKCTCTSRVIIMEDVFDQFKEKLLSKVREITVGSGLESDTWMGPCSSEKQLQTVVNYIKQGINEGATLLYGGKRLEQGKLKEGYYVEPTVFENVTTSMVIAQEEIFGPVLALIKVRSIEEALEIANDVKYGLSAAIFTRDIGRMMTFIKEIDAGLVRINAETAGVELQAPFGGMKESSSHSREQGKAAIEFFTATKTVFVKA